MNRLALTLLSLSFSNALMADPNPRYQQSRGNYQQGEEHQEVTMNEQRALEQREEDNLLRKKRENPRWDRSDR